MLDGRVVGMDGKAVGLDNRVAGSENGMTLMHAGFLDIEQAASATGQEDGW